MEKPTADIPTLQAVFLLYFKHKHWLEKTSNLSKISIQSNSVFKKSRQAVKQPVTQQCSCDENQLARTDNTFNTIVGSLVPSVLRDRTG